MFRQYWSIFDFHHQTDRKVVALHIRRGRSSDNLWQFRLAFQIFLWFWVQSYFLYFRSTAFWILTLVSTFSLTAQTHNWRFCRIAKSTICSWEANKHCFFSTVLLIDKKCTSDRQSLSAAATSAIHSIKSSAVIRSGPIRYEALWLTFVQKRNWRMYTKYNFLKTQKFSVLTSERSEKTHEDSVVPKHFELVFLFVRKSIK